jgi:membrane protein YqaA with SNARE-associated domain
MQLKNHYRLIIFIIFFLSIALLVGFNLSYAKLFIEENILIYGYFAVFVFGFLADFIMQPIGPELPGSIGLIFDLNFYYIFWVVLAGSYLGSISSYFVGKSFLEEDIKALCKKRVKHCKMFKKYGKFALLIACLTPVPYVPFCWLAGASRMSFVDFIIYGLIPRAFRIFIVLFIVSFFF